MNRSFLGRVTAAALSILLGACGADPIDLPAPAREDEMSAIAAEYESPTGSLNPDQLSSTAESVSARIDDLDLKWLVRLLSLVLERLDKRLDDSGLPEDPNERDEDRASVDAVIDLDYVCSGWEEGSAPAPEKNGSVALTALVVDTTLQPDIWGELSGCRARVDSVEPVPLDVLADGEVSVHLYGPLPESELDGDFLVRFVGQGGVRERTRKLDVDVRWIDQQLEFRHAVDDGVIIVGIGLTTFTLRGSNLVVTCDATTLACE